MELFEARDVTVGYELQNRPRAGSPLLVPLPTDCICSSLGHPSHPPRAVHGMSLSPLSSSEKLLALPVAMVLRCGGSRCLLFMSPRWVCSVCILPLFLTRLRAASISDRSDHESLAKR